MTGPRRATFGRTVLAGLAAGTLTAVATARPAVSVDAPDGALVRPPATDLPLPAALSLVVLAAWGAVLVLRGVVRRGVVVLGLLAAVGTAVALGAGLPGLTDRAREPYLAAGVPEPAVSVTGWYAAAWVGAVLSVVVLAAAVRLVPSWPEMGRRYDAPATTAGTPGAAEPDEGWGGAAGATTAPGAVDGDDQRALWRAIDAGQDPTDLPERPGERSP